MIAASSPFKILSDTEGEFGAHSLEFSTPATLRLCRGFPAEVKKLSFMVPEFIFKKKNKKKKANLFGSIHYSCSSCNTHKV